MSNLVPGATYVYERVGSVTYARQMGADPSTRIAIGWDHDPISGHKIQHDVRTIDGRPMHDHIMENKLWGEIRRAAPTNPTLQQALDRAIMIYRLSKDKPL